jgi:AraC family ethanolamine operon transcriptional activator
MTGKNMHWRTRVAHDADEHAHNLSRWEQSYNQFSSGRFKGCVTELWLPKLQVFLESANQELHQDCCAWHGSVWFGLPVPNSGTSRINVQPVKDHTILYRQGGSQFELQTPGHHAIFGVVVDRSWLQEYQSSAAGIATPAIGTAGAFSISPASYRRLLHALHQVLIKPQSREGKQECCAETLQERILYQLLIALADGAPTICSRNASRIRRSKEIAHAARDYVLSLPDQRISIAHLCQQLRISRRALQYSFHDVFGLAPLAYLRMLKLNHVRRMLRSHSPQFSHVTHIATAWGFEHLGEFSGNYRNLFGELPSAALNDRS